MNNKCFLFFQYFSLSIRSIHVLVDFRIGLHSGDLNKWSSNIVGWGREETKAHWFPSNASRDVAFLEKQSVRICFFSCSHETSWATKFDEVQSFFGFVAFFFQRKKIKKNNEGLKRCREPHVFTTPSFKIKRVELRT